MRRAAILAIGVGAGLGSAVLLVAQEPSQAPVFRAGTQVVTVDVSVRRRNSPVTGLTAQDFVVLDNGVQQAIELLAVDEVPVDVSLVFDQTYFSQGRIGSRFASDQAKIVALLRPIDRLRVITFATDVREVFPMQSPSGWGQGGLPNVAPSPAVASLARMGRIDQRGLDFMNDPKLRWRSLFDALLLALARPLELGRRHLVLAFCVSMDSGSIVRDGALFETLAGRADALLHVAFWNRRVMDYTQEGLMGQYTRLAVTAAAVATGGEVLDAADSASAFKSIFENYRRNYIVRYTATGVPLGGWHTVVVKTPRFPNYDVRARRGYVGR
jgi:hypothetical protein